MISNCFQVAFEKKSFKAFILIYSPKHNSSFFFLLAFLAYATSVDVSSG